ncbi:MAG: hypothetical protein IPK81_05200 [Rhodospirillales bacterium]|nr:MAG: hypothetical protein IPK81_05200 [Rhodospirillales bacterium]
MTTARRATPDTTTPRRALASWLALFALTLQVFAPVAHARALLGLSQAAPDGYMVVCSADGLKVVRTDISAAPQDDDGRIVGFHLPYDVHAKSAKHTCCLAAAIAAVAPEAPAAIRSDDGPSSAAAIPASAATADRGPAPERPGHPRDPPAVHPTSPS